MREDSLNPHDNDNNYNFSEVNPVVDGIPDTMLAIFVCLFALKFKALKKKPVLPDNLPSSCVQIKIYLTGLSTFSVVKKTAKNLSLSHDNRRSIVCNSTHV